MNPTAYDFDPPKVTPGTSASSTSCGRPSPSTSPTSARRREPPRAGADQRRAARHGLQGREPGPDPRAEHHAGRDGPARRLPAAVPGLRQHPLVGATGDSNYHALQTSLNRRFDNGLMFSVFYVWSKTLGTGNTDWTARIPNSTDEENRRVNYSYADYDRPHNFVVNLVYQTPKVANGRPRPPRERLADLGRLPLDERPAVRHQLLDPRHRQHQPHGRHRRHASRRAHVRPGSGWSSDPYKQIDTSCFAPPQPGSKGDESARFFLHAPPISNLDMSISKSFSIEEGRSGSRCASTPSTRSTTRSSRASTTPSTSRA